MPLKGITWFRFKEHFRKCLPVYFVGICLCVLMTNLIFTTTRPQTPPEQTVLIYLVDTYSDSTKLDDLLEPALAHGQESDETLQEIRFESIQFDDPSTDYTSAMLIMTRMALGEGDIYLASQMGAEYIAMAEVAMPLDDYIAEGWLAELGGEPFVYTNPETGETFTAGIDLSNVDALRQRSAFKNEGAYLLVANANETSEGNMETSMDVIEFILQQLMEETAQNAENELTEGTDASADSAEPTA